MKRTIYAITTWFMLSIFILATSACENKQQNKPVKEQIQKQEIPKVMPTADTTDKHQQELSTAELFKTKCTTCHDAKRAEDMHASKENFTEIIKNMIKKGAKITDKEQKEISEFLATPSRFLLREKCAKCHTLDRIFEAHEKGTMNKDTIKKMQQKEGSDISEKEADSIYDALNGYYFVAPQVPLTPGM